MSNLKVEIEEPTLELFLEAEALAKAHYEEVEKRSGEHEFYMDRELMAALIAGGAIATVTVRDEEDKLVGYFANLQSPDPFTREVVAKEIGIYLSPEVRGSGVIKRLFSVMEKYMKDEGIGVQLIMFKQGHKDTMPLRLGYEVTEVVYQKIL